MAKSTTAQTNPKPKTKRSVADQGNALHDAMSRNPVAFAAGGLAVGIVAGALLPRSERERELLKGVGQRIADSTKAAVAAAKETGKEHLNASMLSRDAAKEGARKVLESAVSAAKAPKSA